MSGPKDHAAGAPTKCSPDTEDSKDVLRQGNPFTVLILATKSGFRKGYRAISTQ
jgi:hypothetical protein